MIDDPTSEQRDAIEKWLETEVGQKYIANHDKLIELAQAKKQIIKEALMWLGKPEQNNDISYNLVGKFIVKFSHLEAVLRVVFGLESHVQSSFREALMMTFDFALLVSTIKSFYETKLESNKPLQRKMINALNSCLTINTDRVRVAHGVWILDGDLPKVLHLKRGAMSSDLHFGNHQALSSLIKKTEDVCTELVSALFEIFDYYADADE